MFRTLRSTSLAAARNANRKTLAFARCVSIMPDLNANIGEYPTTVPKINRQNRSQTDKWDNQQDRRNFEEPLHEEEDVLTVFGPDVHNHVSPGTALLHISVFVAAFMGVVGFAHVMYIPRPAVQRTYPYEGLNAELSGRAARSQ